MSEGRAIVVAAVIGGLAGIVSSWIASGGFVEQRVAASESRLAAVDQALQRAELEGNKIRELLNSLPRGRIIAAGTENLDATGAGIPMKTVDTGHDLNANTDRVFLSIERPQNGGEHYSAYWQFVSPSVNPRAFKIGIHHVDTDVNGQVEQPVNWVVIRQSP